MDLLRQLFGLDGRIAVVTGGASGLGAAFSEGSPAPARPWSSPTSTRSSRARSSPRSRPPAARPSSGRSTSPTFRPSTPSPTRSSTAHGRVDVLVNSAGAAHRSPIEDFTEEAYDRILALNLKGTYFMSQAIGRKMIAQGKGSIVNIASIGGFIAYPHSSAYLASKGGVVQTTRSFALEWISHGVRVNAIAPGLCETPLLKKALAESGSSSTTDFIQHRMLRDQLIQPDELIAAVIFLAGDGAAKVTGHTLAVDDGYLANEAGT